MDEYGYKYGTTYHNLVGMNRRNLGMEIATVNNRFSIENVRRYLELNTDGYKPISDEWKGGITKLATALRSNINEWKKKSIELCEYKCLLTGGEFNVIHHLTPFKNHLMV